MAEVDPWDTHLEAITGALAAILERGERGHCGLRAESGWTADLRAHGRSVTVSLRHPSGHEAMPGDYARAVVYGCDYSPIGDEGRPAGFIKTLTVRDGFGWDEQMLRELVLEALGLYGLVLGGGDPGGIAFQAEVRERSAPPLRKKRRGIAGR